jgi:hypothetical protein
MVVRVHRGQWDPVPLRADAASGPRDAAAAARAQRPPPGYSLDLRLDPDSGGIAVAGRLDHACVADTVRLYLNRNFRI